jgi:hypothetical protein
MTDPFTRSGPPHQNLPTTVASPYSANPVISSDLTPLLPTGPAPPRTGISDLEHVRQQLLAGKKPG